MINDTRIIQHIQKEVKSLGSQAALAKELGISDTYLSDIINGHRYIPEWFGARYGYKIVWMKETRR